jgi:sugar lactone lactonase YvrE
MKAEVLYNPHAVLGECPVWDHQQGELITVDIISQKLLFYHLHNKRSTEITMPQPVGCIVPTEEGRYLVALQDGIYEWNRSDNHLKMISNVESELKNNRFNDGKCDPQGRFWIGSMDMDIKKGAGSVYCLIGNNHPAKKITNTTISNGIAWNRESTKMYFIDTISYTILAYDFDSETGNISNPKVIVSVPESDGAPDGMEIDENGNLWVAHWGDAKVKCWNPVTGKVIDEIAIYALNPSSCIFGGKDLNTLFVTSARDKMSAQELKKYPLSGAVFQVPMPVKGLLCSRFKPHPT